MILYIHSQRSPQHINWLNVGDTQSELNNSSDRTGYTSFLNVMTLNNA